MNDKYLHQTPNLHFWTCSVDKITLYERMIMEKYEEGGGHGRNLRHCLGSGMEGLRKTIKNLSQDSWPPGLDLNIQGLLSMK